MGVQGLNNIIKKCPSETRTTYKRIIIDGSNLVFTKLSRSLSQLKKSFPIDDWKSVDKDIIFQTRFIIDSSVNDIINFVNYCKSRYSAEEVFLVLDPTKTPGYIVNSNMKFAPLEDGTDQLLKDCKYTGTILHEDEIQNGTTIEFNIKSDEQETRKKRNSKSELINNELGKIDNLGIKGEGNVDVLKSIYQQSFFYNSTSELIKLIRPVMYKVEREFVDENVFIIDAEDEADLVIKNIAMNNIGLESTLEGDFYTLVMSADTDYYILFADSPKVHATTLMNNSPIYSPYRCWNVFLEDAYSYDAVIRVAPLLGNDYTTHESIITAVRSANDIRDLFNIDDEFMNLRSNARKKVYNVVGSYRPKEGDITSVSAIDEMVYNFNVNYFKKYFLSTIIYKNWNVYNRCSIRRSADSAEKLEALVTDSVTWAIERLMKLFPVMYQWNSEYLFTNWTKFNTEIVEIGFETLDEAMEYYNSDLFAEEDYCSEYLGDEAVTTESTTDYCDDYV